MRVSGKLVKKMVEHAREKAEEEVCGIILGKNNRALMIMRATNTSENPEYTYSMSVRDIIRAYDTAQELAYEIIGFYHSHPCGSPVPSGIDIARATWDGAYYVILNLKGDIKAWNWQGDKKKFSEEKLIIE
ncbi:MAG TPA: M67 family peptidase [Euryarchaeota archaeon]|nr:M67 family peptidase [Euryarchaeota archaeon]